MKVLALDLGTKCGWALSEGSFTLAGTWILATPKEITYQAKLRMDRRCDIRIGRLFKAINETQPNWIFFEDVQFASTTLQAHLWASLRGALWVYATLEGISIDCCPVGTLKKFGSGHGASDKAAMARAAVRRYPHLVEIQDGKTVLKLTGAELDDNAIDAIHLLQWGTSLLQNQK
jgi:Holliday junction resolvasome RuvABC endonuclease subunit